MKTIEEVFLSQGQWCDSISPTALNDEQQMYCYYIAEGEVDLFLTKNTATQTTASLNLFLTIKKGSFFLTKPPLKGFETWHLDAKLNPDTKLIAVPYALFNELFLHPHLQKDLEQLIETWATQLTKAIKTHLKPVDTEYIPNTGSLELKENTAYVNETTELLWILPQKSQITLLGNDLDKIPGFPLVKKAWIFTDKAALIEVHSSTQLIQNKRLLALMHFFYAHILSLLINQIKKQNLFEEHQFQRGVKERALTFTSALQTISNFYDKTKEFFSFDEGLSSAKAACKLLCSIQHIPLTIPKEIPSHYTPKAQVNHILDNAQIRKREVALAGEWWNEAHGSLIAFVQETGQAVVLVFAEKVGYQLINPQNGERTLIDQNIAQTLAPFAISIYRSLPNHSMSLLDILFWSLQHHKTEIKLILLITICGGFLGLLTPWITGQLFSVAIPRASYSLVTQLTAGLLAAGFGMAFFDMARAFTLARILAFVDNNGVAAIWDRVTKLPISFFKNYGSGDLLNRASGFQLIVNQIFGVAASSIFDSAYALFYFALLFYYSVSLALICLGILLVMGVCTFLIMKKFIEYSHVSADLGGKLSSLLTEYISGIQKVKTTASESYVFNTWANLFVHYRRNLCSAQAWSNQLNSFYTLIPVLATAFIFLYVSSLIESGSLGLGGFLAFNAAFGSLMGITIKLSTTLSSVLKLVPTFERVKPILSSPPEVHAVKIDPGIIKGNIEVDHVSFKYSENSPLILKDVSFSVSQGEFVAIVGPSGSGKSTLLRLLLQFETPLHGSIFFDDQSLRDLDINMVRRQIGVVLQNSSLLPGSIFENIIGSAPLTLDDAWLAAKHAGFDKDVQQMPMGMHTIISEGSGGLSGGQKQRLLISRALVNKPNLLFFDEATSALDNATQQIVTDSLNHLNATRIVIAHRLSTIINADKILVLVNGRLEEMGTYTELMSRQGTFYKMAARQIA